MCFHDIFFQFSYHHIYNKCFEILQRAFQVQLKKFILVSQLAQCSFLGIFVQKLVFIQKAVNLSSKSLLALTKQVSTCFEDFMNIS